MIYCRVTADLSKLRDNLGRTAEICHGAGLQFAAVTKCISGDEKILRVVEETDCDMIADSRLQNLAGMRTKKPRFMIRPAQKWEIPDIPANAEISFQSEAETIGLLGREAARRGLRHKVVLACDLGDLREGCFYGDRDDILKTAEAVVREPALELYGVGMNLSCFGGVLPCEENMRGLTEIAAMLRGRFGLPVPVVSGGSTVLIRDLLEGTVVPGINHCRIGELWLAGHDPGRNEDIPGFHTTCFTLEAQLIEVKEKPSKPIGPIGGDAFGHVIEREDLGTMRRGILACGRQELELDSLIPLDGRVKILGGSSDHTIVDLSEAPGYRVGDVLTLRMGYGAILRAWTSRYVERRYVGLEA